MHRPRFTAALTLAAALACGAPSLAAQDIDDDSPEVRELVLRGVKHVSEEQLERSLATRESECRSMLLTPFCLVTRSPTFIEKHHLDRTEFRRDVLRIRVFYWERGFRDAQVDTSVTPHKGGGVTVTFNITEGPPTLVARLRVEHDTTILSQRTVSRLVRLRAGEPLNLLVLDTTRLRVENAMWNQGYGDATVDTAIVTDAATHSADVAIRVTPNWRTIVGPIEVAGAEEVSIKTIFTAVTLRSGDLFRRDDLLKSQRSLYESNLFRQATIRVGGEGDSVKPIRIEVLEAPLHEARVGLGVTNIDFLQADGRFTHYNIFGGARRLDISATFSNLLAPQLNGRGIFRNTVADITDRPQRFLQPTWDASIDLRQPAFLHRISNALGVGAFAHRRQAPGIFVDRGFGATATFTRNLAERAPASVNYRYEITRIEASDVYYCVTFGVCDVPSIGSLRTRQSLSPLTLTGFIDRTDVPFNPTRGYQARADLEHGSGFTLSDFRYNRGFLDAAAYTHFGTSRSVLAGHLRLGFIRPLGGGPVYGVIHPRKRFYAGGAQSVRGYQENQLGPRILTIPAANLARAGCDTSSVAAVVSCDPNDSTLKERDFLAQPVGGTSVIEGSVEYRFRMRRKIDGAVFIDGALVGESSLQTFEDIAAITRGTGAITPGFGIRYLSPVGPIRIDLGWRPHIEERLPVVTAIDDGGQRRIVPLETTRTYAPAARGFLNRFTLHLSVGQAY